MSLAQRGHKVTLLTGFPNYPLGRIYPGYRQRLWRREIKNGVQIIRLPLYPDHSRSAIRRTLTYISFALSACLLGPFLSGRIDVMWVYHPPLTIGIPALWISFLRRVPFIYEIQDMWPETVVASGMLRASLTIRLLSSFAHVVYRHAAAITVISEGFKANLEAKGVSPDKIVVIPNWADESIYSSEERDIVFGEQHELADHFNVMFAGTMGPAQGLHTVLEAAEILRDIPEIQFVLVGDGIDLPVLKTTAQDRKLTNVRFIDRQPPERMSRFLAWGDALLVQLRNDPLFHMTIPSKTLTYMACGRPIICAVPGDGAEIIREAGAGLICPPNNPQELAEAIRHMYSLPATTREAMGLAGYRSFRDRFTREKLVDHFETVFHRVT